MSLSTRLKDILLSFKGKPQPSQTKEPDVFLKLYGETYRAPASCESYLLEIGARAVSADTYELGDHRQIPTDSHLWLLGARHKTVHIPLGRFPTLAGVIMTQCNYLHVSFDALTGPEDFRLLELMRGNMVNMGQLSEQHPWLGTKRPLTEVVRIWSHVPSPSSGSPLCHLYVREPHCNLRDIPEELWHLESQYFNTTDTVAGVYITRHKHYLPEFKNSGLMCRSRNGHMVSIDERAFELGCYPRHWTY